jgi:hypothetical protein
LGQSREDVGSEWGIALDGKVMRSAWTAENDRVIPFPAVTHRDSSTIAQVSVPAETNEITEAGTLLKSLGALGIPAEDKVLVTIDAARICRETARAIKRRKRLDYLMSVKGNRPRIHGLRSSLKSPPYPGRAWRRHHRAYPRPDQEAVVLDNRGRRHHFPADIPDRAHPP